MGNNLNISQANKAFLETVKTKQNVQKPVVTSKKDNSKNKKMLLCAVAGLASLSVAGILVYKNKDKLMSKIRKITSKTETVSAGTSKGVSEISTKVDTPPIDKPLSKLEILREQSTSLIESLDNPKAYQERQYVPTDVYTSKTSIQDDIQGWIEKRKTIPMKDEKGYVINVVDNVGLADIKPHEYVETSDIYIKTRAYKSGFPHGNFAIQDDKLVTIDCGRGSYGSLEDLLVNIDEKTGYVIENTIQVKKGLDASGKACVYVGFFDGRQDKASRKTPMMILLRSKTDKFNQDQIDLINMFSNLSNEQIMDNNPLGVCFLSNGLSNNNNDFTFNRNVFNSVIHHFAQKHEDFDINKLPNLIFDRERDYFSKLH